MTLAVAWVREVGAGPEMLFASDSRLRQGGAWDTCPKLFKLPRSDALMAFAGDTLWAYPIVLQTINDVEAFPPSRRRQSDLRVARGHALRVINQMLGSGDAISGGLHVPDTEFFLGGWSWEAQRFLLWRFHWNTHDHAFRHETIVRQRIGLVRFIGDRDAEDPARDLVGIAKQRLYDLLAQRGKTQGPLDMEPFEVLVAMLRSNSHETIGGPPQLAKVYRHMNAQFFAVMWPNGEGVPTLAGRELLDYEQLEVPVLNPDNPTMLPVQARKLPRTQNLLSTDSLLLPAIEGLGAPTTLELLEWSETHAYGFTHEDVEAWLEDAEHRGLLRGLGEGRVELAESPRESAE
jgi:hypothetical protein